MFSDGVAAVFAFLAGESDFRLLAGDLDCLLFARVVANPLL